MPTYEYECTRCGGVSELFQSISASPKRKLYCEQCKEDTPVRRLIGTGGGIVFKGSGFYTTDYRSESYKKAAESEKPSTGEKKDAAPKTDTGSAASSKDSKPAESTPATPKPDKPKPTRGKKRS